MYGHWCNAPGWRFNDWCGCEYDYVQFYWVTYIGGLEFMHNSSSGVSETIGFVLILGMVITGIALVTLFGYPMLLSEQANANYRNMEKGMIVLQNDIKSIAYKSVPFKETTLQVSGGALTLQKPAAKGLLFTITYGVESDSGFLSRRT